MRKTYGSSFFALTLFPAILLTTHDAISQDKTGRGAPKNFQLSTTFGVDRPFWAPNRIGNYITNNGQLVSHLPTGSAGMEWPVGTGNHINFSSGLWLAGQKQGTLVTAAAIFDSEFQPGNVNGWSPGMPGTPADPADDRFKVYSINESDIANPLQNPDYLSWPVYQGAPVNASGNPLVLGSSTAFAVFNDFSDSLHMRPLNLKTEPVGVEVQMTAWAFDRADALGDAMFFKFKFINKSGAPITDAYAAIYADIDIGDAQDLVSSDSTLSLGFNYKKNPDRVYGASPPAIGYLALQAPIVPSMGDTADVSGRKLPRFKNLEAFFPRIEKHYEPFHEPRNAQEAYYLMRGLDLSGQPLINPLTGLATRYYRSGDPVAGTGWIDSSAYDKRLLLSSGPFAFGDGEVQELVVAIVIAQGQTGLESVSLLKQNVGQARFAYDSLMTITEVDGTGVEVPAEYSLEQNYPNPFNPATTFGFSLARKQLVTLRVYDVLGKEVATIVQETLPAGRHRVVWESAGLASGIYFYRLQAGAFSQTRKLTLLR
jgi:hypothetical protein